MWLLFGLHGAGDTLHPAEGNIDVKQRFLTLIEVCASLHSYNT